MKPAIKFPLATVIIIILSLIGSVMIFYATTWGPWAYSDSTEYIVAARNLLAGHGLGSFSPNGTFHPLTLHPPFYPLVLSASGLLGFDLLVAARWLNIVLFGGLILLSGILTYQFFHSAWLAALLSAALLTLPALVDVSSGAMSELLFLFASTLGISSLIFFLVQRKNSLLILSSLLISLAFLTRYPGVVAVVLGILGIVFFGQDTWKVRFKDASTFSLITIAPTAIWMVWVSAQTKTLFSRSYNFYLPSWSSTSGLRLKLMKTFWGWLPFQKQLPAYSYNHARNILLVCIVLLSIALFLLVYRRIKSTTSAVERSGKFHFVFLWLLFALGNLLFLAVTYLFTEPQPDLNARTLLPIQIGLVFTVLPLTFSIINEYQLPKITGWASVAIILIFTASYTQASGTILYQYHQSGAGYTGTIWRSSQTLQQVHEIPTSVPIITNQTAALSLLLDRPSYELCTLPCGQTSQLRYGDDLDDPIQKIFRENQAALVYFYPYCGVLNEPWYAETKSQLQTLTQNLKQVFSSCDGAIYFYPSDRQ